MIESILLTATPIFTFNGMQRLTNASGFFFQRGENLFLVTSRHVLRDDDSQHFPDRIEIELHTNTDNIAESTGFSMPLYHEGRSVWRQGTDTAGKIDVAVLEIEHAALPVDAVYRAFSPQHLPNDYGQVQIGAQLLVVGFPFGFHDSLHHLPVVRQAIVASSFGLRFQGEGYFLTDARTHRGTSGAAVVMRLPDEPTIDADLPWVLLGVHSARLDIVTRDLNEDEALGLNCAWYSDVLLTLT